MARMTEEEAFELDDFVTNNKITLGPHGSDWLSQREMRRWGLTDTTVKYILARAAADGATPAEIINELVQEKVAAE